MRKHLSYSNVVATLALVLAVGTGGAWAAKTINGSILKSRTISGNKVRKNSLTGIEIRESKLGIVPRASNSLRLGGRLASAYLTAGGTAANATNAVNATNAANAANADKLGGIASSGFVQGAGKFSAGRSTGTAGSDPNVFKTFTTPVGEFRLGCGAASVDVRYFNTTPDDADVFRHFVGATTGTNYDVVTPSPTGVGYAANDANGPAFVDIRAGKGEALAILRVGERRQGLNCIVNWELLTSA
jgi:hypothetical protein